MGRSSEFKKSIKRVRHSERVGGLRYYARATSVWVEQQPAPTPQPDPQPQGTYANPGVGPNGESSN